jgi:hypothetical protein
MRSRLHDGSCQQQIEYLRARTEATTAALRPDRFIGAPAKAASLIGSPIQNCGLVGVAELRALVAALAALVAAHPREHCLEANLSDRAVPNRLTCRACPV